MQNLWGHLQLPPSAGHDLWLGLSRHLHLWSKSCSLMTDISNHVIDRETWMSSDWPSLKLMVLKNNSSNRNVASKDHLLLWIFGPLLKWKERNSLTFLFFTWMPYCCSRGLHYLIPHKSSDDFAVTSTHSQITVLTGLLGCEEKILLILWNRF